MVGLSFAFACACASACVRRGAMQQASKRGEMVRRRRKALMLCDEPCRPGCLCRGCRGWGEGDASWSPLCALAQLGVTGDARATKSTTSASPRIRRLARGSGRPVDCSGAGDEQRAGDDCASRVGGQHKNRAASGKLSRTSLHGCVANSHP